MCLITLFLSIDPFEADVEEKKDVFFSIVGTCQRSYGIGVVLIKIRVDYKLPSVTWSGDDLN